MNKVFISDYHSARKALLKRRISEAFEGKKSNLFLRYQSQWVHRYGLETLPDHLVVQTNFAPLQPSREESLELSNRCNDESIEPVCAPNESLFIEQESQMNEVGSTSTEDVSHKIADSDDNEGLDDHHEYDSHPLDEVVNDVVEQNVLTLASKKNKGICAPPPPALNHLRKWLPGKPMDRFPRVS